MEIHEIGDILAAHAAGGTAWHEFFRVPMMSAGVYRLPAGGDDPQHPHEEDEIYYVLAGRATILVNGTDTPVQPGSFIFVEKLADHRFHSITEDLTVLVIFAPAHAG